MNKTCTRCHVSLPADTVHFPYRHKARSRDGLDCWCRNCHRDASLNYYRANRETMNAKQKPYWQERAARITKQLREAKGSDPITLLEEPIIAYLAGLIDGEGCFTVPIHTYNGPVLNLRIQMTCLPVLIWVAKVLNVTCGRGRRRVRNHREQWIVQITGQRAAIISSRIAPYLHVKQEQAALFVEYAKTIGGGRPITKEVKAIRLQIREAVMRLNSPTQDQPEGEE